MYVFILNKGSVKANYDKKFAEQEQKYEAEIKARDDVIRELMQGDEPAEKQSDILEEKMQRIFDYRTQNNRY